MNVREFVNKRQSLYLKRDRLLQDTSVLEIKILSLQTEINTIAPYVVSNSRDRGAMARYNALMASLSQARTDYTLCCNKYASLQRQLTVLENRCM